MNWPDRTEPETPSPPEEVYWGVDPDPQPTRRSLTVQLVWILISILIILSLVLPWILPYFAPRRPPVRDGIEVFLRILA